MRIIAGDLKGRVIASPSDKTTRPTTDRVRESMFSAIYSRLPELQGVQVLDAFAGSGALGIEALSRGAESCVFIERDKAARSMLEKNLASLDLTPPRARVLSTDAFDVVASRAIDAEAFGLVLLDPPYAYEPQSIHGLLCDLASSKRLVDGCLIVYEHALESREAIAELFAAGSPFEVTGDKKYGKIGVTYLKYHDSEE